MLQVKLDEFCNFELGALLFTSLLYTAFSEGFRLLAPPSHGFAAKAKWKSFHARALQAAPPAAQSQHQPSSADPEVSIHTNATSTLSQSIIYFHWKSARGKACCHHFYFFVASIKNIVVLSRQCTWAFSLTEPTKRIVFSAMGKLCLFQGTSNLRCNSQVPTDGRK